MEPISLPSHVHYELLLQLLERQTLFEVGKTFGLGQRPHQREQVQQLISTLRKALAQQKQLEDDLQRLNIPIEYRWSLNSSMEAPSPSPDITAG
ncbi:DUF5340 family protein [Alkalinema sp. FACHB-956]|uniref:DUF5340 family protein n=1 Tax=Alkalinema sp. FACHB-956 TaxID=2692768 RepID=UPI0016864612|nr:DUF5340 family protein [Alkalinema sp. FACHB-956]MBD2329382.1 DUF5340 family protein [Alkalinema sp. FACHB-956]